MRRSCGYTRAWLLREMEMIAATGGVQEGLRVQRILGQPEPNLGQKLAVDRLVFGDDRTIHPLATVAGSKQGLVANPTNRI